VSLFIRTITARIDHSLILNRKSRLVIVGAGILGLSVALESLRRFPSIDVKILEKEAVAGSHASGRNSRVIHAGLYYQRSSMKADFAVRGNIMMRKYMEENALPMRKIGKIIVAKSEADLINLQKIFSRAIENKAKIELLNENELTHYEPLAKTYKKFLWSPNTAIGSPQKLIQALEDDFLSLGGAIIFRSKVSKIEDCRILLESGEDYPFDHLVNCAGTGALSVANKIELGKKYMQLPVAGGYLSTPLENLPLNRLVYSAPHPLSPFLGVHFTQTLDGRIRVGPSAIPLLGSEQYFLYSKIRFRESIESLNSLLTIVSKNPSYASKVLINQVKAGTKNGMLLAAKELVPSTEIEHGWDRDPAGIRAQLVDRASGKLVDDFIVEQGKNSTHILNAVSPGWTSAFPFAQHIVDKFISRDFGPAKEL